MNDSAHLRNAEPFFLKAGNGDRFCIYHHPSSTARKSAFIYVHPFAEEMNKSRRMAALQSRAFARAGFGVLQIDLFGCGDSSGDFSEARWHIWKEDLASARSWLLDQGYQSINLWGLRLGALLALDVASTSGSAFERLILWQPVTGGEAFLTQFLRMRLASDMFSSADKKPPGTKEMRAEMADMKSLEIAGYELAHELASSIDRMNAADLIVTTAAIDWIELVPEAGRPIPPATARVASAWEKQDVDYSIHLTPGAPFWSTQEISECPSLIDCTIGLLDKVVI
jgi:exosortase A-associated hydrolase 2